MHIATRNLLVYNGHKSVEIKTGDPIPEGVDIESIVPEYLAEVDPEGTALAEVPIETPEPEPEEVPGPELPTGSVPDILAAVGDDAAMAQMVLDRELGAEQPRSSLVDALGQILA